MVGKKQKTSLTPATKMDKVDKHHLKKSKCAKSGFKRVCRDRKSGKWNARYMNGKISIGAFEDPHEAATAYFDVFLGINQCNPDHGQHTADGLTVVNESFVAGAECTAEEFGDLFDIDPLSVQGFDDADPFAS